MNLRTRPGLKTFFALAAATGLIVVAGCGGGSSTTSGSSDAGSPIAPPSDTSISENDVRFALQFLPNHDQGVEIAEIAAANTDNPDVLVIAEQLKTSREPEVEVMRGWIAGQDQSTIDSAAASAPGVLTQAEMDELRNAKGEDFDKLFARYVIVKHNGAIEAVLIVQDSSSVTVRGMSQVITETLADELAQLEALPN